MGSPVISHDRRHPAEAGRVGIVWVIRDGLDPLTLVTDCTSLPDAEPYGDFLTHPRGHHEVWEGWRRLGAAGLARRSFPPLIVWHEHEDFPRRRVVFDTTNNRFTLPSRSRLSSSKSGENKFVKV